MRSRYLPSSRLPPHLPRNPLEFVERIGDRHCNVSSLKISKSRDFLNITIIDTFAILFLTRQNRIRHDPIQSCRWHTRDTELFHCRIIRRYTLQRYQTEKSSRVPKLSIFRMPRSFVYRGVNVGAGHVRACKTVYPELWGTLFIRCNP
jgi:hypothetical protein